LKFQGAKQFTLVINVSTTYYAFTDGEYHTSLVIVLIIELKFAAI
jgi:hypothetical protein